MERHSMTLTRIEWSEPRRGPHGGREILHVLAVRDRATEAEGAFYATIFLDEYWIRIPATSSRTAKAYAEAGRFGFSANLDLNSYVRRGCSVPRRSMSHHHQPRSDCRRATTDRKAESCRLGLLLDRRSAGFSPAELPLLLAMGLSAAGAHVSVPHSESGETDSGAGEKDYPGPS